MPTNMNVTATVPANKEKGQEKIGPISVEVPYAETLEEAKQLYGEEAMLSNAFANWRVTLQANMRSAMRRGESPEQIQERMKEAKMGVAQKGVKTDPTQAYLMKFQSATPEEQQQMLQELRKRAAAIAKKG